MRIGLDIGSTTIKCVVLNDDGKLIYSSYTRHYSHIKENLLKVINILKDKKIILDESVFIGMSGSAGMGIAQSLNIDFVQEVYATRIAATTYLKDTDCIIELEEKMQRFSFKSWLRSKNERYLCRWNWCIY